MAVSDLPGAPIWVELYTSDPQAAAGFYGRLFGWTTQDAGADDGGYLTFLLDGAPVAGCLLNDGTTGGVNAWSVYLESDDAEATVRMAEANGGTAGVEPIQVGDLGRMAFVEDPGGAMVGVWEPGGTKGSPRGARSGRRRGSSCSPATSPR